jgi:hypothetical protein
VNSEYQRKKKAITSNLTSFNIKETTTYDIRNPGLGLEQAHKCGSVNRFINDQVLNFL